MIKTLYPYGSVNKKYFKKVFQYQDKYYLKDRYGNTFLIDEVTYKEYKND